MLGGRVGKRPRKPAALKGEVLEDMCLAPDQGTGDFLMIGSDGTALFVPRFHSQSRTAETWDPNGGAETQEEINISMPSSGRVQRPLRDQPGLVRGLKPLVSSYS